MRKKKKDRIKHIETIIHDELTKINRSIIMENKRLFDVNSHNGLLRSGHHIQSILQTDSKYIIEGLNNTITQIYQDFDSFNLKLSDLEQRFIAKKLNEYFFELADRYLDQNRNEGLKDFSELNGQIELTKNGTKGNVQNIIDSRIDKYQRERFIMKKPINIMLQEHGNFIAVLTLIVAIITVIVTILL